MSDAPLLKVSEILHDMLWNARQTVTTEVPTIDFIVQAIRGVVNDKTPDEFWTLTEKTFRDRTKYWKRNYNNFAKKVRPLVSVLYLEREK